MFVVRLHMILTVILVGIVHLSANMSVELLTVMLL